VAGQLPAERCRPLAEAGAVGARRFGQDNAKAESFMSTLKREEVDGRAYRTAQEARRSIGRFIEDVYNRQRLHSGLSYLAPPVMVLRRNEHAVNRA
jgi:transposase InsO family protein